MEIEEIKKRKKTLEESIRQQLSEFTDETTVGIDSVRVKTLEGIDGINWIETFEITCKL